MCGDSVCSEPDTFGQTLGGSLFRVPRSVATAVNRATAASLEER
jgi:hypothetical protein